MDECGHVRLELWSGGYYLACGDCGKRWVSIKSEGNDAATDHDPRYGSLIQGRFEYQLLQRRADQ